MEVVERPDALSRRSFLALGATIVVSACASSDGSSAPTTADGSAAPAPAPATTGPPAATVAPSTSTVAPPTTHAALAANPFALGVSSGDPDERSAVLWTRLVGADLPDEVDVDWEVATDDSFAAVTASGQATATAADGHSVHVTADVTTPSWFRFRAGGHSSAAGRVAPTGGSAELRIAAATCQHFETGWYAAHRDIAAWAPDLVVFLGDFIYEGAAQPVGGVRVRAHDGPEPTDLAGYRARYAQYLGDADLQAARAACPWLIIWDDHEVENNYAGLAPQDPAEAATFPARRAAAYRAWWEHMPVRLAPPRDGEDYDVRRSVRWGDLADVVLLDGRQFRSDQACGDVPLSLDPPCPEAADPARTMLGPAQEQWFGETVAASRATWCVVAQQTVMADLRPANGAILNYDQWDGYAPARERLLAQLVTVPRPVVLTGDIHLAGVGLLPGIGVEFVTTSISSLGDIDAALEPVVAALPNIAAAELRHRGYTRHTVSPEAWLAEYRIVDDIADPASTVSTWRTFRVDGSARDLPVAE